ncbi:DUF6415 family natural product biosynthesis protein [Streptomyces sp. NPDC058495]|uniref:DUF6415 family natural product biosynthesis protein n=1 Tax=unclassified Streptomyces TaxID=2593676 RepID=UPI0036650C63
MPDTHPPPDCRPEPRGTAKRARTVYDPTGTLDTRLPLDRAPHEQLAAEVLGWGREGGTPPARADIDQAALVLAGYARLLVDELRRATAAVPQTTSAGERVQEVCTEAASLLARPALSPTGALDPALVRARLVVGLHAELDRLRPTSPCGPRPAGGERP